MIYREGAPSHAFYVLTRGSVLESVVGKPDPVVHDVRNSGPSGGRGYVLLGMEALFGQARASTLEALENIELIKFSTAGTEGLNMSEQNAVKVAQKV